MDEMIKRNRTREPGKRNFPNMKPSRDEVKRIIATVAVVTINEFRKKRWNGKRTKILPKLRRVQASGKKFGIGLRSSLAGLNALRIIQIKGKTINADKASKQPFSSHLRWPLLIVKPTPVLNSAVSIGAPTEP